MQASKFVGVSRRSGNKWLVEGRFGPEKKQLGTFACEYEAARRYDMEARKCGKPVNFPVLGSGEVQAVKLEKLQTSNYKGVTFRHSNAKKWAAQITVSSFFLC
jgi:hypothetical protein